MAIDKFIKMVKDYLKCNDKDSKKLLANQIGDIFPLLRTEYAESVFYTMWCYISEIIIPTDHIIAMLGISQNHQHLMAKHLFCSNIISNILNKRVTNVRKYLIDNIDNEKIRVLIDNIADFNEKPIK